MSHGTLLTDCNSTDPHPPFATLQPSDPSPEGDSVERDEGEKKRPGRDREKMELREMDRHDMSGWKGKEKGVQLVIDFKDSI